MHNMHIHSTVLYIIGRSVKGTSEEKYIITSWDEVGSRIITRLNWHLQTRGLMGSSLLETLRRIQFFAQLPSVHPMVSIHHNWNCSVEYYYITARHTQLHSYISHLFLSQLFFAWMSLSFFHVHYNYFKVGKVYTCPRSSHKP